MKIGIVFPGQGSQYVGMGKELYGTDKIFTAVLNEADDALHFSLSQMCLHGPEDELTLTANAQPGILSISYALWKIFERKGIEPACVAGHSLGEYTALLAAGVFSFADAVKLVRKRGQYMQEAVPVGQGAMAAIIGLSLADAEQICHEASNNRICACANYNSQDQVVISGDKDAVNAASELARQKGAKRVIPLKVSAPFHCQLMKPVELKLKEDIQKVVFKDLSIPLFNNVDASEVMRGMDAKNYLIKQITAPVMWYQIIMNMSNSGVNTFIEIGPGKVLTGLIKRINPDSKTYNIQDAATLEETFSQLSG